MRELLLGCGNNRIKRLSIKEENPEFQNLVTLDIDPSTKPDVVWNLDNLPYPFQDEEFDEIHAYEVLEHTGTQGDYKFFFEQFNELYRILKNKGKLYITVPYWQSIWALGDPGHRRVFNEGSFTFLDRSEYEKQVGITSMTDYRHIYHGHFNRLFCDRLVEDQLAVILEKDYVY